MSKRYPRSFRLRDELWSKFKNYAELIGVSRGYLIERILVLIDNRLSPHNETDKKTILKLIIEEA